MVDKRICVFCAVAGDDINGFCGRIVSLGYDLWAHIICLSFNSVKKRYWDYGLLKVCTFGTLGLF